MSTQCSFIKPRGERCRGVALRTSDLCAAHDPSTQERRRRGQAKGGKAKGNPVRGEIDEIRFFLRAASAELWNPKPGKEEGTGREPRKLSRQDAAVLAQLSNVRLRLVELERKLVELAELDERIAKLEAQTVEHSYSRRSGRFGS